MILLQLLMCMCYVNGDNYNKTDDILNATILESQPKKVEDIGVLRGKIKNKILDKMFYDDMLAMKSNLMYKDKSQPGITASGTQRMTPVLEIKQNWISSLHNVNELDNMELTSIDTTGSYRNWTHEVSKSMDYVNLRSIVKTNAKRYRSLDHYDKHINNNEYSLNDKELYSNEEYITTRNNAEKLNGDEQTNNVFEIKITSVFPNIFKKSMPISKEKRYSCNQRCGARHSKKQIQNTPSCHQKKLHKYESPESDEDNDIKTCKCFNSDSCSHTQNEISNGCKASSSNVKEPSKLQYYLPHISGYMLSVATDKPRVIYHHPRVVDPVKIASKPKHTGKINNSKEKLNKHDPEESDDNDIPLCECFNSDSCSHKLNKVGNTCKTSASTTTEPNGLKLQYYLPYISGAAILNIATDKPTITCPRVKNPGKISGRPKHMEKIKNANKKLNKHDQVESDDDSDIQSFQCVHTDSCNYKVNKLGNTCKSSIIIPKEPNQSKLQYYVPFISDYMLTVSTDKPRIIFQRPLVKDPVKIAGKPKQTGNINYSKNKLYKNNTIDFYDSDDYDTADEMYYNDDSETYYEDADTDRKSTVKLWKVSNKPRKVKYSTAETSNKATEEISELSTTEMNPYENIRKERPSECVVPKKHFDNNKKVSCYFKDKERATNQIIKDLQRDYKEFISKDCFCESISTRLAPAFTSVAMLLLIISSVIKNKII